MLPLYENVNDTLEIYKGETAHVTPHLHKALECVYITEGSLALGVGVNLYPMETHDFAIIFPELIHHCQVFDAGSCRAVYLLVSSSLVGGYLQTLQDSCPESPVIKASSVHPDIPYALDRLIECPPEEESSHVLWQAYTQIILARSLPLFSLTDKSSVGSDDIIYRTVSYIASHFAEEISLTQMAEDLGYSPYVLSRVFSGTFHCNFNTYLNHVRLDHACNALLHTDQTITEVYENAGFASQRTFNRVFREKFRMSPKDYRKHCLINS